MRTPAPLTALLLAAVAVAGCSDDDPAPRAASAPGPSTSASSSAGSPRPTPSASPGSAAAPSASAASPSAAPPAAPAGPAPTGTTAPARPVRLTGDGVDLPAGVVPFGTPYEQARGPLAAGLGPPTLDTGETGSFGAYGTCPGSRLRAVEHGGGALVLLFGDVAGPELTLYGWTLTAAGSAASVPQASALVGDVTTLEFGVGTPLSALQAGAGDAVQTVPGDELLPASFRLQDQSAGFSGYLTGTSPADTVTFVLGGQGCGE